MNLTGRSYALAVIIVSLAIVGEWTGGELAGFWRYPAVAVILALTWEVQWVRRLQLAPRRTLPSPISLGRKAEGSVHLQNPTVTALQVQAVDEAPEGADAPFRVWHWRLPPRGEIHQPFGFTPVRLGSVRWERLRARVLGPLGLAWWSRCLHLPAKSETVPDRLQRPERRRLALREQGEMPRRRPGQGFELLALREYRSGDPLRIIDWKATARSIRPVVRLFSEEQRLEVVLLVDAGRASATRAGALDRLGHYVNVAARLAEKCLYHGDQLSLITYADRILGSETRLKGESGLRRARRTLASLTPTPWEANHLGAVMQARRLVQHRALVVMLTDLDDGDAASQLVKAMGLLRPTHQPLLAGIMDEGVLAMQTQEAREWLDPYETLAAHEMAANWRRTRLRLAPLGVPVVLAPADRLGAQLFTAYDDLKARRLVG